MSTSLQYDWLVVNDTPGAVVGYRAIIDSEGFTVCAPSPMGADNARLIAAAPAMLHALHRLVHPMADDSDVEFAITIINRAMGGAL